MSLKHDDSTATVLRSMLHEQCIVVPVHRAAPKILEPIHEFEHGMLSCHQAQ